MIRALALIMWFPCLTAAGQEGLWVDARWVSRELGLIDVEVVGAEGASVEGRVRVSGSRRADRWISLRERGADGAIGARIRVDRARAPEAVVFVEASASNGEAVERRFMLGRISGGGGLGGPRDVMFDTPGWAMGRVWYQVFPERFWNGEASNDPRDPRVVTLGWTDPWWEVQGREVEAAWLRRQADPRMHGYRPSGEAGAFSSVVFARRYGGDLQGVVERLDHLERLGVDGLYLCPIFQSRSLHKYDAADHRHVDSSFGGSGEVDTIHRHDARETADPRTWRWTEADRYFVDTLIPEARRRGMRVMLDGVWNHVGMDHWAFRDVMERGRASAYADWFEVDFDDAGRVSGWQGWTGRNGDLPEFRQTPEGDLAPAAKAHVFEVTRRWMDPNGDGDPSDGVDGWRLDVAAEVGRRFWADWRALVKSINPEALIIAELWFDGEAYYDGTAFDGQMNYPFAFAVTDWLEGTTTGEAFVEALRGVWGERAQVDLVQLNLLASHDTARLGSMLDNPGGDYDGGADTGAVFRGDYKRGPLLERAKALSVVGAAIQAMAPGAPMIYGGDEFGLAGPDDPSNRQPLIWPDIADEVEADRRPDRAVAAGYARWLGLRSESEASEILRYGDWSVRAVTSDVVVIERSLSGRRVVAAFNRGTASVSVDRLGLTGRVSPLLGSSRPGTLPGQGAAAWVLDEGR
ncbi:MAG: hypothetical protein CMJ31_04755 [Phycisphaerae bacterium]|nr:hypothetical protein [Phycisphaerae bacterium]